MSDKIIASAVKSISEINIEPNDPQSLSDGVGKLFQTIEDSVDALTKGVDFIEDPTISKFFQGVTRAVGNALDGDFEALISRGGLSRRNIDAHVQTLLKKSPKIVASLVSSIAGGLVSDEGVIQETARPGRVGLIQQGLALGQNVEAANRWAEAVIKSVGGIDVWYERVLLSANAIAEETEKRAKIVKLTKNFIPNTLVGQLLQFSKAIDKTVRTINVAAKLFDTQIAEIAGGISAPSLDFDFGKQQVGNLVRTGALDDLFASTPDIPKFVGAFIEIEKLLDNFIINISNIPKTDIDIDKEIDKFFEFQKNAPQSIRDNFEDFFKVIAEDITLVSEGKFIDAEDIKQRFKKEFEGLGIGASDSIVESITGFMKATFTQIEDELNILATVRRLELDVAVRPSTQASFLREQLGRVGISAGGFGTGGPRGTVEELDLKRRERLGDRPGFGFLETPPDEFFQGRGQGLADIVGNETTRRQVREGFKKVILESSRLKAELAGLKQGTQNFTDATNNIEKLSRKTIEFQTTLEALNRATGQALAIEQKTLALEQRLETSQVGADVAEDVRRGRIKPLEGERILFDLGQRQQQEQFALQSKFESIIEKDNALRVDLAKEISANTKTEAEIIGQFDVSTRIFSDATRIHATTADLMRQNIASFGQAVVDFTSLTSVGQTIEQAGGVGITPSQIRSGGTTIQQGFDEFNRLVKEGNASQTEVQAILNAIYDRQEQLQPIQEKSPTAKKEQSNTSALNEETVKLTESMERLAAIIKEPNEITLVSDQRVVLDLSTLPAEVVEEVHPLLEEASIVIAKTVARKAMESLAAKSDSEVSIAASDTAQELI